MAGPQLPALSYFFGLTPSDVDDMTVDELDHYAIALQKIEDAQT